LNNSNFINFKFPKTATNVATQLPPPLSIPD
jgi:hypothetical protein